MLISIIQSKSIKKVIENKFFNKKSAYINEEIVKSKID